MRTIQIVSIAAVVCHRASGDGPGKDRRICSSPVISAATEGDYLKGIVTAPGLAAGSGLNDSGAPYGVECVAQKDIGGPEHRNPGRVQYSGAADVPLQESLKRSI
jgi:hypothetical protein